MNNNQKYRSNPRDEPKITTFLRDSSLFDNEDHKQPRQFASVDYSHPGKNSLTNLFEEALVNNTQLVNINYSNDISRISETFNFQYELASPLIRLTYSYIGAETNPAKDVLVPCFHKSLIGLTTSFFLTKQGLWGPARPLIRHAFESLIIAKFCSVHYEADVYDKWIDGKMIYLSNAIFKKIVKPDTATFSEFWGLMSDYTHSSIYALQPDFKTRETLNEANDDDVRLNFIFIEMMLECQYHLLISHIATPSLNYYQEAYLGYKLRTKELKKALSSNYKIAKQNMGVSARQLIKDYRSKWEINF